MLVFARDPEGGECLALQSPCLVPDGWEYFTDEAACGGGLSMCRGSEECDDGQVCDVRSCISDDVGICVSLPEDCSEEVDPVWGCDGVQYANDCQRLVADVRMDLDDAVTGCADDAPVWARDPETGACTYFASSCYVPSTWPLFFGREECEDRGCSESSVWVWDPEEGRCVEVVTDCDVPSGFEFFDSEVVCSGVVQRCGPDAACPGGTFCEPMACGSEVGQCVPLPNDCMDATEDALGAVCGCDGVTYGSDCQRIMAGVGLARPSPCGHGGDPGGW
jgi:hypothetical protein